MNDVPSLLPPDGELHDYEVRYVSNLQARITAAYQTGGTVFLPPGEYDCRTGVATYIVRQSKSVKNALASFDRAVPGHGPIRSIRKVVGV